MIRGDFFSFRKIEFDSWGTINARVVYASVFIAMISNHCESINRLAFVAFHATRFYSINKSSPDPIIASLNSYA